MDVFRGRKAKAVEDLEAGVLVVKAPAVPQTPIEFSIYAMDLEPHLTRIEGEIEIGAIGYEFFCYKAGATVRLEVKHLPPKE